MVMEFDAQKLKKEQIKLNESIIVKDDFEKCELLGGCDFIVLDKKIGCAIVIYDPKEQKIIETQIVVIDENMSYQPSFLFYRFGPAAVEAYHKLQTRPDVLFVAGNGILHPRKIGLASHLGLVLDIPTIGVSHKLFFGEVKEDGFVYYNLLKLGAAIKTREFSNPVIVSQGHKISLRTAINLVKENCISPHKLPEPLHIAHRFASKLKKGDKKDASEEDEQE